MPNKKIAVSVSILFIVQMLTAAIGNTFVQAFVDGDPNKTALTIGVLLMMFSGLVIAAIGLVLYRALKPVKYRLTVWIPAIRIIECAVAIIFGIYVLTQSQVVPNHLLWVYILAGSAGVILGYLLFVSKLVPRPIAVLGIIGYSLILIGVPLDFAGVLDMNQGVGQIMLIPGGLFEIAVLPIWLIAKGFNKVQQTA